MLSTDFLLAPLSTPNDEMEDPAEGEVESRKEFRAEDDAGARRDAACLLADGAALLRSGESAAARDEVHVCDQRGARGGVVPAAAADAVLLGDGMG